ncbi:MAG: hypothetical protein MJ252_09080 [archaeon]|nr:hypothetical protein [archaeon]
MNLQHPEKNVLYLSDLSLNVVQADLENFLKDYKDSVLVINLDQKAQAIDYQRSLRAKVIFKDAKSANKVRTELNLKKIKGHSVRIMWDERDSSIRYNTKSNLFIKGIPETVTPREVYEYFRKFGDISSLKVPEDESGSHHGYGYITYYAPQDAENAIAAVDKETVFGVKLEVSHFQRKNERNMNFISANARTLYLKNYPDSYTETELQNLCSKHGTVEKVTIFQGHAESKYAIVTFANEEDARTAFAALSPMIIEEKKLLVQPMQSKYERRQFIQNQIRESNIKLNDKYHLCNLHIRNIPYGATEEDLRKAFEKYGNIKSVKIEKFILDTQENNQRKEILTSKGFGYLCFDNQESAKKAKDEMNGKFLEGYESWNRPILIDYFMPKNQRMLYTNRVLGSNTVPFPYPFMNYATSRTIPPRVMAYPFQKPKYYPPNNYPHQRQNRHPYMGPHQNPMPMPAQPKPSPLDETMLKNCKTEEEKRDYLGEIIYKSIQESPLATTNGMSMDTISKITGMIIGIANLDEVISIVKNPENLNGRIEEGLELLRQAGQA